MEGGRSAQRKQHRYFGYSFRVFTEVFLEARLEEEKVLLDRILLVDDLQSAWLLHSQCAASRSNHLLRVLPPEITASYAKRHDDSKWETLLKLLHFEESGWPPELPNASQIAREVALLSCRHGVRDFEKC